MCGIVGVASTKALESIDESWLNGSLDLLRHRGPDSRGTFRSPKTNVLLGHTRLAILDLSTSGSQPMSTPNERYTIVFNGEIYNYRSIRETLSGLGHSFESGTDTEVLLKGYEEWGSNVLDKLLGAFAFAIYDQSTESLFMARDRFGEKPLYYSIIGGSIVFGSEPKVILSRPNFEATVDRTSLDHYIRFGYGPRSNSMLSNIHKLPPAHYLTWQTDSGELNIGEYWSIERQSTDRITLNENEIVDQLHVHLSASVDSQFVSDVPIGVLLSGGLDSSLITALASESGRSIQTFTVTFPEHERFNEGKHARSIAEYFETKHTEIPASRITPSVFLDFIEGMDDPIADSSALATFVLSELVAQHCTVAIGGDGADELFGGYVHYQHLIRMQGLYKSVPHALRAPISRATLAVVPYGVRGRYWISAFGRDAASRPPILNEFFDPSDKKVLRHKFFSEVGLDPGSTSEFMSDRSLTGRALRRDLEHYLPDDILIKVDRMSMLQSLEIRAPFLDKNVVGFVLNNIPLSQMVTQNDKKIYLRKLGKRLLPATHDLTRKQGFSVPLISWIRSDPEWRALFNELLLGSSESFHEHKIGVQLLRGADRGRDTSQQIFSLAVLELWRRKYHVQPS